MGWATFWAIFSQTHPVTLLAFPGHELLFQDATGGLSIFNFAQNKTQLFMANTTFVSPLFQLCFKTGIK
jgi:hypothetical protein